MMHAYLSEKTSQHATSTPAEISVGKALHKETNYMQMVRNALQFPTKPQLQFHGHLPT